MYHMVPIRPLFWSHAGVWVDTREYKTIPIPNVVLVVSYLVPLNEGTIMLTGFFWSSRLAHAFHPVDWLIRLYWKLMYSVLIIWWFLYGIDAIFLWSIMYVILWRLEMIVIEFMGIIDFFVVLLLILLLILIDFYICGVILVLRVLIFDIIFILLTNLLINYYNIRGLIHSWNIDTIISNRITSTII